MKTALIGCGHIAHVHARFLHKIGRDFDIVCDLSNLRATEFAKQYGKQIVEDNVEKMLATHKPDVVHILVPPQFHFSLAKQCLESGSNVFVEKPICETTDELNELIAIAQERNLVLSVDHTRVYNPMVMKAREKLASGSYGKITHIEYDYDDPSIERTEKSYSPIKYVKGSPPWFRTLRGGVTYDLLPHPISIVLSFIPDLELKEIWGRSNIGTIEELIARLESKDSSALIRLSLHTLPLKNKVAIYCENGTIFLDLRNLYSVFLPNRNLPNIVARVIDTLSESWQSQLKFIKNTLMVILGRAHTYDGLDQILTRFYEKIEKGDTSPIPYIELDKVTAISEQILKTLVPDDQTAKALEASYKKSLKSRLAQKADILVTGGTGFIGGELTQQLVDAGETPRLLCRSATSAMETPKNTAIHLGDLRSTDALKQAMQGVSTVYHCAAAMSGDWSEFYSSTVVATENLLAAADKADIKKLVYVSSLGVLDYNKMKNGDNVDESSPVEAEPDRRGFYTKAKTDAESMVMEFSKSHPDCEVVIVRPGLVYGKQSNNNLNNAGVLLGRLLLVFGLGNRYLGLNYVKNLAKVLVSLGRANEPAERKLFQVVDAEQPTVKEYINAHNAQSTQKIKSIYIPIFVWKLAFKTVDLLLTLIRKKNPDFSYRFKSNSKRLLYKNSTFGKNNIVEDYVPFNEALKETLSE